MSESVGYIRQFGFAPLIISMTLTISALYLILNTNKARYGKAKHIVLFITILLFIHPVYSLAIKTNSRIFHEFSINPQGIIADFYSRNIISPITNYISYLKEQRLLSIPINNHLPDNVILGKNSHYQTIYLVIGESASSNHFSYTGYKYPTTPFIDDLKENKEFYWVPNAISPAPITRESLKRVLSFATASDHDRYYDYTNIVKAARNKGFETIWLSSQNFSGVHDTPIGVIGRSSDFYTFNLVDDTLLDEVTKKKNTNVQQFFFIHLNGSHAPYTNYDDLDLKVMLASGSKHPEYDATIRKTDRLLSQIINQMSDNSLLIYLSDHGEVAGLGHGLHTPSQDQFNVPFFIYDNSGSINDLIQFLTKLRSANVFNTQMTMEFILNALGYEFLNINIPNPTEVYFSDGSVMQYDKMVDIYDKRK
ncbi:phosphoethanolamine transferase [Wohlfahrtiimonas sp. G9077]|uniref:phosphoethanolamine transferase n=1 Tax=Wohlfahrtiimonas sp. G9077 TaxID=1980118 RepID=UPI001314B51F|nr:phosphoethanolamine transferase [Wohlfahrtiimonas sp. G9077]